MIRLSSRMIAIGTILILAAACAESQSSPSAAESPGAINSLAPTSAEAATYAVEVLSGQHWDNPDARASLRAHDLIVESVGQAVASGEQIWEVRLTGRFEIQSCPVRRLPTPGTRICDEGEHGVVRFRAIDGLETTIEIATATGTVTFGVNYSSWGPPTPSS